MNARGFQMTREIIDDEAGWIIGRRDKDNTEAFYAVRDRSFLPPPRKWSKTWQYIGQNPCPSVALHELDAIALGYDESEVEAAAEQLRLEMEREEKEAKRRRDLIDKVKRAAARAKEEKAQQKNQKRQRDKKLQLDIVGAERGDGSEFFPVSPDRQRALARRPKTQALAWQTPEAKARKSLARKPVNGMNRNALPYEKESDIENDRTPRALAAGPPPALLFRSILIAKREQKKSVPSLSLLNGKRGISTTKIDCE